ncbi:MAG: restriction endonuclease subunit S [Parvularcula sp.]|jgi:type I restriction enzyme S subunit|nr:restriction endonuclease subunit S [Parvularcula sp.]
MSWPTARLDELCDIQIGRTPARADKRFWDGGTHPWASIADISRNRNLTTTKECITDQALSATKIRVVPAGTVLMSFKLSIGKVAIARIDTCTNEAIASLSVEDPQTLDRDYLARALESLNFDDAGDRAAKGKTLNKKSLAKLEIPLPPLDDQKRIAAILDQADELRRKRQRAIDRLNQLGQAIFHEMFGDPGSNPKGWPVGTVRDLIAEAKYGTAKKANTDGKGTPILRMGNLSYDGQIDLSDMKYVELESGEFKKYTTKFGDILFNRTNSKELVGKTAVVMQDEPLAIAGYLVRARMNDEGNPFYVSAYLNSPHGKKTLRNMCKNIVGMANINAQEFQNIRIAKPPKDRQDKFQEAILEIESRKAPLRAALAESERLFHSLQHRAFQGEL